MRRRAGGSLAECVYLNDLVEIAGINPAEVQLIRHAEKNPETGASSWSLRRSGGRWQFDLHQSLYDTTGPMGQARRVVSFVAAPESGTLFVGIWDVGEHQHSDQTVLDAVMMAPRQYVYDLRPSSWMSGYAGRQSVEWSDPRSWYRDLPRTKFPVMEIRRRCANPVTHSSIEATLQAPCRAKGIKDKSEQFSLAIDKPSIALLSQYRARTRTRSSLSAEPERSLRRNHATEPAVVLSAGRRRERWPDARGYGARASMCNFIREIRPAVTDKSRVGRVEPHRRSAYGPVLDALRASQLLLPGNWYPLPRTRRLHLFPCRFSGQGSRILCSNHRLLDV